MFEFISMMDNYEERKVARYEENGIIVDTCLVTDSDKPYETAIAHPNYNNGLFIIVADYDTKEEAAAGHTKWVKIMTLPTLPRTIKDVSTAGIAKLCIKLSGEKVYTNTSMEGI